MIVAVARETFPGERRVALIPAHVPAVLKTGVELRVEARAGEAAGFPDERYVERGATIAHSRDEVFQADVVLQVRCLGANPQAGRDDLARMRSGQTIIGMGDPLGNAEAAREMAERGVTLFALELIPRITRAQSMDVLSSMATIAGYKAALLAANHLPRMFPMLMTAAGTLKAAKVFVIGAGVAGLQAIASSRRLGAIVQGYDVRPAVKEQVESLGARFVEMQLATESAEGAGGYAKEMGEAFYEKQRELMTAVVAENDVCITTAAIPGTKSPLLITADAVRGMQPGSVIVDLAAERGGNCELSRPDEVVVEHGVTIFGPTNLPSEVPQHASQMFGKNMTTFVAHLIKDGQLNLDLHDEITRDTLVAMEGQVVNHRLREMLGMPDQTAADAPRTVAPAETPRPEEAPSPAEAASEPPSESEPLAESESAPTPSDPVTYQSPQDAQPRYTPPAADPTAPEPAPSQETSEERLQDEVPRLEPAEPTPAEQTSSEEQPGEVERPGDAREQPQQQRPDDPDRPHNPWSQ